MWGLRQGNPGSAGRLRNSWVPKSLEFCKKSVMSTFSEGRKIYFETIFFIQDFFPKQARSLLSNAPRIIKIGSLSQFRHPLEFVDPIFRLQNSMDFGIQFFSRWDGFGSEIMDFVTQTSHFQSFLTLRVFNRFLIGWKFWNRVIFLFAFFWGLTLLQSLCNLVCQ